MNLLQKPYYPLVQGICLRAAPLVSVHFCALCAKFEFLLLIEGCSTLWALAQVPCHRQIMRIKVVLGGSVVGVSVSELLDSLLPT